MSDEHPHYTSPELERLLGEIPDRLLEVGVATSGSPVEFGLPPELVFSHHSAAIDRIADTIAASRPTLVFVAADTFATDTLIPVGRSQAQDMPALAELVERAQEFDGELFRVRILWAVDGMRCEWQATTEWAEDLMGSVQRVYDSDADDAGADPFTQDAPTASGSGSRPAGPGEEAAGHEYDRLVATVLDDPDFRATPMSRRRELAGRLLRSAPMPKELRPLLDHMTSDIVRTAESRTRGYGEFVTYMVEAYASELVQTTRWREARTRGQQRAATVEFLRERCEGWRLTTPVISRLADCARDLDGD